MIDGGPEVIQSAGWLERNRTALYPLLNVAICLACIVGAAVHDIPFGIAVYTCLLFALCSAPLLFLKRINNRYALLAAFMMMYFLFFGALDLQTLLLGVEVVPLHPDLLSEPELAIVCGAAAVLIFYNLGVLLDDPRKRRSEMAEWPMGTLLFVGLTVWVLGTVAMVYFQIFIVPSKTGFAATKGLVSMGPALTFIVMLGHMMQPLGILMMAYGYARQRSFLWFTLVLMIVVAQVIVGFIEDIKMQAMIGGVLVIMVRTLTTNRLPLGWIAAGLVFIVVAFPIFQAYRAEVTGARGLDREQAFKQLDKVIDVVLAARTKVTEGHGRSETFIERASSLRNMEILFDHVGRDVPLLYGHSLVGIPMAFVPRILVPDKEDFSVGMLFGKQILKADGDVYISITHLGELYWNFGWAGVLGGMSLFGLLLGYLGTRFDLEQGVTLTRILVLLITIQSMCIGFTGTMPVSYLLWMRSMAAIGLMHWIFARPIPATLQPQPAAIAASAAPPAQTHELDAPLALPVLTPRFPNLMR